MTIAINGNGSIAGVIVDRVDPVVRAYRGTPQVIADAVFTTAVFDNEATDTANNYNPATGVFTASVAGFYQVNWACQVTSSTSTLQDVAAHLRRNGVIYRRGSAIRNGAADINVFSSTGSAYVLLAIGDTLDIQVYGDVTSGTVSIGGGADLSALDIFLHTRT